MKVPTSGGAAMTLVSGLNSPSGISVDATTAYFSIDTSPATVASVPLTGGVVKILATLTSGILTPNPQVLNDAVSIYWADGSNLMRLAK